MLLVFIVLFFISLSQIALAQAGVELPALPPDAFVEKSFLETILSGDFFIRMAPIVVGTQVILYGVAEGLTRIAVVTENKWDNKLASWLSEAAWVAGVLIGKFGYSTPKLVIEEKAKEVAEKEKSKGG